MTGSRAVLSGICPLGQPFCMISAAEAVVQDSHDVNGRPLDAVRVLRLV